MPNIKPYPILSPEEAVCQIFNGATVAFSGFTNAGAAKQIPRALASRAEELHSKGIPLKIRVLTGASSGSNIDEPLAKANAMSYRTPYQSGPKLRAQINAQEVEYVDMHLSHLPQTVLEGFQGKIDFAVIEATEITRDGRVYLTTSVGASPTYLKYADRVIVEVNRYHSPRLREMTDILIMPQPPHRVPIPMHGPLTKLGYPYAVVDPKKVIAVIDNDEPDTVPKFADGDERTAKIAENVVRFLVDEMLAGRIPPELLPIQAGVGNVANAVMGALARDPYIPPFQMFTEVFQDSLVDLMQEGRLTAASTTSLTLAPEQLKRIYDNMDFFSPDSSTPAGTLQSSGGHQKARGYLDEHRPRDRHIRQRQCLSRLRHADHERDRRQRRVHSKRLYFHLHVPLCCEGRENLLDCSHVPAY